MDMDFRKTAETKRLGRGLDQIKEALNVKLQNYSIQHLLFICFIVLGTLLDLLAYIF